MGSILLAMVFIILTAAAEAYSVALLKPIFDNGFTEGSMAMLKFLSLQIFAIYVIKGVLGYFKMVLMTTVSQKIIREIQRRLFNHLLSLDMNFFNRNSSGKVISRMVNETDKMSQIAITFITQVSRDAISCISMFAIMIYFSWRTFLFVCIMFPIGAFLVKKLRKKMGEMAGEFADLQAKFMAYLIESFANVRVIKSYNMEKYERGRVDENVELLYSRTVGMTKITALTTPIMESLSGVVIAGILMFGGMQVVEGSLTIGGFVAFLGAWVSVYKPLKSLTQFHVKLQAAKAGAERIYAILDTEPTIKDKPNAKEIKNLKGDICFNNVCFEYDEGKPILSNVSFDIPAGKTVALVGSSGGGKTTIAQLIPRFWDVKSGRVLIDGVDIRDLKQSFLRDKISIVNQDTLLFDDTIRSNIAYGGGGSAENVCNAKLLAASKAANAHEFISGFEKGYDTQIGERGVMLSGGQKQRISIARALIKDSPILLLDEATSALDTKSEAEVQNALTALMKNRTTLVIAHRLSTIVNADRILVVNNGRIVESGTHDELLAQNGEYAKLYNMQFKDKKTSKGKK
ncbi:MAG: ABC transporter transmembrane domain-containing protein [Alphaproteobacteria bacterium]|nr:ABC transporter transmembrane domain-containing protein [Alphaproteobacteria bacterium]